MTRAPLLSVIVITRNEGVELRRTVENIDDTVPADAEIVVVDDGSTDRSADYLARRRGRVRLKRTRDLGVACARNFGAGQARGEVLFFADAHIRLKKLWWQPLLEAIQDPKVGAAAGAVTRLPQALGAGYGLRLKGPDQQVEWLPKRADRPFHAPILPGCCLAMRRDVFAAAGGFDSGLLHRGGVDNELSLRLWLFGFNLMVVPEVLVKHLFREESPYPVGWPQFLHNKLRLAFAHFGPARLTKVINALRKHHAFGEALALVVEGGISARRSEMMARRVRGDDWYFEKFGMKW
jgi:GT2 family glycosyltransferase